jgi:hypothetical protein
MKMYSCRHEYCENGRWRVWGEDDVQYGTFSVITHAEYMQLIAILNAHTGMHLEEDDS